MSTQRLGASNAPRPPIDVRDLIALSGMSVRWIGRSPAAIAEGVRELLITVLRPDAVRVELRDAAGGAPERTGTDFWATGDGATAPSRVVVFPIGREEDSGHLAIACQRAGFPTELESVILHVIADQVDIALRYTSLLRRHERAELVLERAVASRDRAVSIVSHDLGNALSTVQICANALLDRESPTLAGVRDMADIIRRSTAWMQQIVQDLLDRTSLDAGELVLDRHPTAAIELIGAAQVMFAPVAHERGITLLVETDDDLPAVDADAHRLLQVLSNLLGNAMKFTARGGTVVLSARGSSTVRFDVRDTGPGIPPEDLRHIFDWFWHVGRTGQSGAGLGLAIAAGLVEAHDSHLNVESELGRGSAFWFTMPAALPRATSATHG